MHWRVAEFLDGPLQRPEQAMDRILDNPGASPRRHICDYPSRDRRHQADRLLNPEDRPRVTDQSHHPIVLVRMLEDLGPSIQPSRLFLERIPDVPVDVAAYRRDRNPGEVLSADRV